jgi:NNP family nitrate/nitrite transporter-like MFS transporter
MSHRSIRWINDDPLMDQSVRKSGSIIMNKGFLKAGHLPTLTMAFVYFDLSFMAWVILGPLGVQIGKTLGLDAGQKGLMVAIPVLAGAFLRIVNGVLVDRFGPKAAGVFAQLFVIGGLLLAWSFGVHSFSQILLVGIVLGMAGASFAVALPLASRWYPPEYQGTALGIAGAGNSGTVLAAFFAPGLAIAFGWNNVLGLLAIPLVIVFVLYVVYAKDAPNRPAAKSFADYIGILKTADAWWLMLLYSVTFGGFVGLGSSLPIYYNDQYGLTPVYAGYATAACVFVGSMLRPIGGAIADRIGGVRTLSTMYLIAALALIVVSFGLPHIALAVTVFMIGMGALGMGNGAVFQLVPQRFGREIGIMTGLIGMMGGVGGFYLASSLGYSKQFTGNYQAGFLVFAILALGAFAGLNVVKRRWRASWSGEASAVRI